MIGRAIIRSAVILLIAGLVLLTIRNWGQVLCVFEYIQSASNLYIQNGGNLVKSLVVILAALAMLVCCWLKVLKQREYTRSYGQKCSPLEAPYPAPGWKCITGFRFKTDLCLTRLQERDPRFKSEKQYLVAKDYIIRVELDGSTVQVITVPRGTVTDLASVPRIFRWYVGRVGRHLEASIVHDWLYVAWQEHRLPPTDNMRLFSDRIMLAGMQASGMGCKAYAIYWAIRAFGTCVFYGRNPKPYILEKHKMPDCCCHEPMKVSSDWIGP